MSNLFLEQKDDFGWHDGQQVPRASLQVSFCKDLVEPDIRRTLIARHVLTSDGISEATLREIYQQSYVVLADQAARRARDAADRAKAAAQRARGPGPRDANDVWVRMPPVPLEYQGRGLARRFFSTIAFRQGRPPGGQQILKTPRVHLQRRGRPTSGRCSRRRHVLAPLAGSTGAAAPCAPRARSVPRHKKENNIMTAEGGPVRDDQSVTGLVTRARHGDQQAWDALVERYAPLIWSICRRHRLDSADTGDVGQSVWLHLVDQLDRIRDPAALPGWLATTTQRECVRVLRAIRGPRAAGHVPDAGNIPDQQAQTAEQELLAAERHAALREAFAYLPPGDQQLITLLIQDPPVPYAQISARLGIPVGSIGPNRRRCLDKLRRHPALAALTDTGTDTAADQTYHQKVMHR